MLKKTCYSGFTMVEILVTVVIMLVLFSVLVARYNTYNDSEKVRQAALTLKSNLRLAQSKAMQGQLPISGAACTGFNGYYVQFVSSSRYDILPDCNGDRNYPGESLSVILPPGITFSPVPSSFYYKPVTHGTSLTDTLTITLTNGSASVQLKVATVSGAVSE